MEGFPPRGAVRAEQFVADASGDERRLPGPDL